jgi:hypothetical protein
MLGPQCVWAASYSCSRLGLVRKWFPWLTQLLARRRFKVVAVALANKMARMVWALLAHGGTYRAPELADCLKGVGKEEKRRCNRVHELRG